MSRPRAYIAIVLGIISAGLYGVTAGCISAGLFLALSASSED